MTSLLERELLTQCSMAGLPTPVAEYRAIEGRRFRFDLAFIEQKLLIEVQGGIWNGGKHGRGAGIETDQEKLNLAVIAGWRVLHVSSNHVKSGKALMWIRLALSV